MSDERFSSRDWQSLGFASNVEAFEALDRDQQGFYTLLTEAYQQGKKIPLPWKRYLKGLQDEKSAKTAVRNSLKSNSGRKGIRPVNLNEFISEADRKKIDDLRKRLAKLEEAVLKAAKEAKEKEDARKRILEMAQQAGLTVKLE